MHHTKALNLDIFNIKKQLYLFSGSHWCSCNVAFQFIQILAYVSWPLNGTTQCFICATHLCCFRLIRDYVRGYPQFTHRRAPSKTKRLHNEWNMHVVGDSSHRNPHYIPYQTETSIAETWRERERASEGVSQTKKKMDNILNNLRNRCQSRGEHLFGNDGSLPKEISLLWSTA